MILKFSKIVLLLGTSLLFMSNELDKSLKIDSIASFYHNKFEGRKTATGEVFHQNKLTAANNLLPLGTKVKVTRIMESETLAVEVRINDRIAKKYSHRIDLSKRAAKELKITGLAPVKIEVL